MFVSTSRKSNSGRKSHAHPPLHVYIWIYVYVYCIYAEIHYIQYIYMQSYTHRHIHMRRFVASLQWIPTWKRVKHGYPASVQNVWNEWVPRGPGKPYIYTYMRELLVCSLRPKGLKYSEGTRGWSLQPPGSRGVQEKPTYILGSKVSLIRAL